MPRSRKSTGSSASRRTKSGAGSSRRTKTASSQPTAMSGLTRYSIGIDPGYGCLGIVLVKHGLYIDTVVGYALRRDLYGRGFPTVFRSARLAAGVIDIVAAWIVEHDIRDLAIGLELPIYNRNAEAYAKQWTLIQALEYKLTTRIAPMVESCWIAEPNPSESKHLATGSGSASKSEIYNESPFTSPAFEKEMATLSKDERETLSDAWAHSLSARSGNESCDRRFDARMMIEEVFGES